MSEIKLPLRRYSLILALLTSYLGSYATENNFIGDYTHHEITQRLADMNAQVDFKLTPEVKKYLTDYIVSYRQSSEKLIGRSLIYFPNMENKLFEKQLPSEIKYLSVIESSLKPTAKSRAGAVGLWQFMKSTAKMYGLQIDKHVDERQDVEKSTEAALEYLKDLNERFGDWTLALAAYNCGPGNVRKAMRRSGGKDYWSIRNHLPRETRNYVPKFIAIAYVMNYYHDHDLTPNYPEQLFIKSRKVKVYEATSFSSIAEVTGLDLEIIQDYNPSYIGNFIPKSKEGSILELPTEEMYAYLEKTQTFEHLIPDPMQDLQSETKVASQKIEKREYIEIAPLETLRAVEKTELLYVNARQEVGQLKSTVITDKPTVRTREQRRKMKLNSYAKKVSDTFSRK